MIWPFNKKDGDCRSYCNPHYPKMDESDYDYDDGPGIKYRIKKWLSPPDDRPEACDASVWKTGSWWHFNTYGCDFFNSPDHALEELKKAYGDVSEKIKCTRECTRENTIEGIV